MRERQYSRRQFMITCGTAASATLAATTRLAAAAPMARLAAPASEDLAVAGALLASPLAAAEPLSPALIAHLVDHARRLGAQLHSPVPAGTRLHYVGQPLGIVLAPERATALAAATQLADELRAGLPGAQPSPILKLAAALPQAHAPRSAAEFDVLDATAERAFADAPYRLRQTYHSAAYLPRLTAPLSVLAGAHLPLPKLVLSHPPEPGLRQSLADWSKLPADWFQLAIASPAAEPAQFEIPAKLAWSASSKLRRPVELILSPEQSRVAAGQRPEVVQTLSLGAERDGRLRSLIYRVLHGSPHGQQHIEPCGLAARLYAPAQRHLQHQLVPLAIGPLDPDPRWGYIEGSFALESALDELAYLLKLDPGQLRLRNLPPDAAGSASAQLRQGLLQGRERFDWPEQVTPPGQRREGSYRIGQGLALGQLPLPRSDLGAPPRFGYVAHLVRLRIPDGQPALQLQRYLALLWLPEVPATADRELLRASVRRALAATWQRCLSPAPAYDPQTGALLPAADPHLPELPDEALDVEFMTAAEPAQAAARSAGSAAPPPPPGAGSAAPTIAATVAALSQCGAAAALANALYSATGYRQRRLPFDLSLLARPTQAG